jgi:signal transduction histidine kinase
MSDFAASIGMPSGVVPLSAPCTPRQWRTAAAAMAGYAVLVLALTPWARVQGPVMPQITAVFTTGIIVSDLATGFVLLQQLRTTPAWSVLLIACAYLYSTLMGVAHLLTFPGALAAGRPLVGHAQLANYVFNIWRLGYGLPILAAARIRGRASFAPRHGWAGRVLPWAVGVGTLLGLALGFALESRLPPLIVDSRFTGLALSTSWVGVAAAVLACVWLWARRSRDDLFHLWLALAMTTFTGDIYLSTVGGGRFTVGWYAGRASGCISACTLFLFFLMQFAAQQRLAVRTAETLRERTERLQAEIFRRAEAEERLAQAQKLEAMGQLTGGIAHDFNNLLAAVIGNLDLLSRRANLDARGARWVATALDAAERGAKLTGQMLVFARAQRLELKPVDVTGLIEGAHEILLRPFGPDIAVRFELAAASRRVVAEPNQLELAVLNLFLNARDAMPDGGILTLSTTDVTVRDDPELEPGDYLRLTVRDTGVGMAPEVLRRAFDPFFTTKGVGGGAGLGLSQVFGFARRVGGTARVESRPGEGASVHLFLRHTDEPTPVAGAPEAGAAPLALTGPILVVDDDAGVREVLVTLLSDLGFSTLEAADGVAGLALLAQSRPALLVADFAMPGLNGARLAQEARALIPGLPVMFVTGYADTDAIEAAVGKTVPILRKPFRPAELQAAIAKVMG